MEKPNCLLGVILLLIGLAANSVQGQLRAGFYSYTCPNAEDIVKSTVQNHFQSNPRIAPGLLRTFFHDCFVRGCDGSVLIDATGSEKRAIQNVNTPGYEVINDAKAQLEAACPGIVSCADILALAARDSVVATRGIYWEVLTGRRDGRVSIQSEAASTLPGPSTPVDDQISLFADNGLDIQDLVVLVGGHTIGTTSCGLVQGRLFNFNSSTGADPSIDPSFVETLRALCPQGGDASRRVELDNGSGGIFDTSYFHNLRNSRGILTSDQLLWSDVSTRPIIERLLGLSGQSLNFNEAFANSMIKMGNIGVKTGSSEGEIRGVCTAFN